jgi:hypothetical protein
MARAIQGLPLAVRKRVFSYVRQHPGCTTTQINREVGTLAGMKE